MALYKHAYQLKLVGSDAFDQINGPDHVVQHAGIYRCIGCPREIALGRGQPLPTTSHHVHLNNLPVKWRLIVAAEG